MKYYQQLATMPTFTLQDVFNLIGNLELASKKLNQMVHDGIIHRIRRNLYTCVNFNTGEDYASRYQIASAITPDSFISYHSAFEFYGCYNQVYFEVQVSSTKKFLDFYYDGYTYKNYLVNSLTQVDIIQGAKITSLERTIVDSINMLGKVMDAEELVKCLDAVHYINEDKILEMLKIYDKEVLYRKVGYVLSYYKDEFLLSDNFFDICKKNGVLSNKGLLVNNDKISLKFNSEWGLYAYEDLKKLAYKGGYEDV